MIIVADTGPLNYLVLIGQIDVLQSLYSEVLIPPAVQDELLHPSTPEIVRQWISNPPHWLEIRTPGRIDPRVDPTLDEGEREAITLMQNSGQPSLLLIDDLDGRFVAVRLGLDIIGTLGVLAQAHQRGLLDLRDVFRRLRATNFKATDALYQRFLDRI